jgi:hypothetical protein
MQVIFESPDPEGRQLRDLAIHRVRFVMRRVAWFVPRATVQLADINGPDGGVDKRCRIELSTGDAEPVVVTSLARDWRTALESALRCAMTRAGRMLPHVARSRTCAIPA